jgi:transcriptional regulator with XRE-family HTH domain
LKNEELAQALGTVYKSARLEASYSQEALARRCGLKRAALAAIERGEKAITVETAQRIAVALGMPLSEVFHRLEEATQI